MTDEPIEVHDNAAARRFEITVGDDLAGFTEYTAAGGTFTFVHTEIDDAFAGRGLASRLIQAALDDMRRRQIAVLPLCPFVQSFIERHPDHLDLVPVDQRQRFGLPAES